LICLFGFSESTCPRVSKISFGFLVHALLGQQVLQQDVYTRPSTSAQQSTIPTVGRFELMQIDKKCGRKNTHHHTHRK
jgi:hypothetical protein